MSEAKPFASLSSGLLARKGAAKPAMRRPNTVFNPEHVQENGQDDLGWNDMGYDVDPDISGEVPSEKPINPLAKAVEIPKPEVKQQQDRIAAQLQIPTENDDIEVGSDEAPEIKSVEIVTKPVEKQTALQNIDDNSVSLSPLKIKPVKKKPRVSKKSVKAKARAAFTLRLDPERHLKLRLACAIENISAQKFVTDALDRKLNEMNQIDLLSGQIVEK